MDVAVVVTPASGAGQDRAIAVPIGSGCLVVVADGAGGIGGGDIAAQFIIDALAARAATLGAEDWHDVLKNLDRELATHSSGGQTTVVAAFVDGERIMGASVGDSAAWYISREKSLDLTEHQQRKPLLGSGHAQPVCFNVHCRHGRLLLGSDGLFKYAASERIRSVASTGPVGMAARALADCVRLPSGTLQDDVAVILLAGP